MKTKTKLKQKLLAMLLSGVMTLGVLATSATGIDWALPPLLEECGHERGEACEWCEELWQALWESQRAWNEEQRARDEWYAQHERGEVVERFELDLNWNHDSFWYSLWSESSETSRMNYRTNTSEIHMNLWASGHPLQIVRIMMLNAANDELVEERTITFEPGERTDVTFRNLPSSRTYYFIWENVGQTTLVVDGMISQSKIEYPDPDEICMMCGVVNGCHCFEQWPTECCGYPVHRCVCLHGCSDVRLCGFDDCRRCNPDVWVPCNPSIGCGWRDCSVCNGRPHSPSCNPGNACGSAGCLTCNPVWSGCNTLNPCGFDFCIRCNLPCSPVRPCEEDGCDGCTSEDEEDECPTIEIIKRHCCEKCRRQVVNTQTIIVIVIMPGDVRGTGNVGVQDALQILRYVVGLDSVIANCESAFNAARITGGVRPGARDALQILRRQVGLPSLLD
jgi:hypothetical protein